MVNYFIIVAFKQIWRFLFLDLLVCCQNVLLINILSWTHVFL